MCTRPWVRKSGDGFVSRPLSCGQCIECKLKKSREDAMRCVHEASLYGRENSFVLLTYADKFKEVDGSERCVPFSLVHDDFQRFMKRLRKAYGEKKIKYFMSGEYGEPCPDNGFTFRPHYHSCLFNVRFEDAQYFKKSPSGAKLYRSRILERLWPYGHCTFGEVTFESAAYVARYVTKKITCPNTENMYADVDVETGEVRLRIPEYSERSNGLGLGWLQKYAGDLVYDGKIVVRGKKMGAPRYYKDKLQGVTLGGHTVRVRNQKLGGVRVSKRELVNRAEVVAKADEYSPHRAAAREAVALANLKLYK